MEVELCALFDNGVVIACFIEELGFQRELCVPSASPAVGCRCQTLVPDAPPLVVGRRLGKLGLVWLSPEKKS